MARESTSGASFEEKTLETLTSSRGWRFRDLDEIRSLILSHEPPSTVDSIEAELMGMDLSDFGAKSLPDPSSVKKISHLQGPLALQVVSARDIYQSSIEASFKSSNRRLIRFVLTDGFSEITAIEYSQIPSIAQEIVPGTKVRLENKVPIHSGILCLSPQTFTIMGGVVESLFEEWQMSKKYSGLSRTSIKLSPNDDGEGPPPFEKLQTETNHQHKLEKPHDSNFAKGESSHARQVTDDDRYNPKDVKTGNMPTESKKGPLTSESEERNNNASTRPKEAIEAVPVQNQAAAQKLLQKMQEPISRGGQSSRGRGRGRGRGRDREEEQPVFTLEEWEKRNSRNTPDTSRDEEMARELQQMMDLENYEGTGAGNSEAEQLRSSMFSFNGGGESYEGREDFRRRGRGRGRGGGRGRGPGRGRRY